MPFRRVVVSLAVLVLATAPNKSANPAAFTPFEQMPGNSADPLNKNVCWK